MNAVAIGVLIGVMVSGPALGDDATPALLVNPFERPAWLGEAREVTQVSRPEKRRLELRATLLGNPSLANVGGRIIGPGDEVDGYTLVAVRDGEADFRHGDTMLLVRVLPQPAEQNND